MEIILVTGGAGFIGSHTCLALLEKGYKIYVVDSLINSSSNSIKNIETIKSSSDITFFKGDIRDTKFLNNLFLKAESENNLISSVIHFAGLKSVSESVSHPLQYWDANVNGTLSLLHAMNDNKCRTLIFSSSATVYGATDNIIKLKEDQFIDPINPYGTTKATIEKLLNNVFNSLANKWRIANLRYFNPIGAHYSGLIGENPSGIPNNIFPYITQVAYGKLKQLKVFGNDWPTLDGTGVRDYVHVMDIAEGHIAALEFLNQNKPQILNLNLGTGVGTSVLELIKTFQEVNSIKIPYIFSERRDGDLPIVIADNSLAKSVLQWEPKRSISQMCKDGWKWQCKYPEGF